MWSNKVCECISMGDPGREVRVCAGWLLTFTEMPTLNKGIYYCQANRQC